jgi:ornithine cyclodeaminase
MVRLIGAVGIEPYLVGLAGYIEEDFRRWNAFEKPPRVASHSRDGVIELMPTSDGEFYGFKYVSGHPKNTRTGLQTVMAFGVLSDVETGYPHRRCATCAIWSRARTTMTSASTF